MICDIVSCGSEVKARKLCVAHYKKLLKYGDPTVDKRRKPQQCRIEGCLDMAKGRGYCGMHYQRELRNGSPLVVQRERHGMQHTSEYHAWAGMRARCYKDTNKRFPEYGERGIRVCSRWRSSFLTFYEDIGPKPTPKHSIDRRDNDGNYSCGHCEECVANNWPANCRWATSKVQASNRRSNNLITIGVQTRTLRQWAEVSDINYMTIYRRIKSGWPEGLLLVDPRTTKPGVQPWRNTTL